jgi:hypothetical protein
VIGGSGCIWEISETHFNEYNVYNHFLALGEKLWTPKDKHDIASAAIRIPKVCKQGYEFGFYVEETCAGIVRVCTPNITSQVLSCFHVLKWTMMLSLSGPTGILRYAREMAMGNC